MHIKLTPNLIAILFHVYICMIWVVYIYKQVYICKSASALPVTTASIPTRPQTYQNIPLSFKYVKHI